MSLVRRVETAIDLESKREWNVETAIDLESKREGTSAVYYVRRAKRVAIDVWRASASHWGLYIELGSKCESKSDV